MLLKRKSPTKVVELSGESGGSSHMVAFFGGPKRD
jgi:hypothetical protein